MPGLQASRTSTAMAMENAAVIELCDGRSGTKSPWREFAEKMAIFAGYSDQCSSGSEHQPDSACLVDMVLGFMEESEPAGAAATPGDMAEDRIPPCPAAVLHQSRQYSDNEYEILEGLADAACPAERIARDETIRALRTAFLADRFPENEESKCRKRRAVMNHLRNAGYNAAVCKTRGKYAGSFPSGDYEYIDVEMARKNNNNNVRLVVDIDFRAQFEIARPTGEYSALVRLLPEVFVGRAERLQQIISIMCLAAKRSLKTNGMHLPPWRKHKYMQAKWLGPYKRTTNPVLKSELMADRDFSENQVWERPQGRVHEGDDVDAKVANNSDGREEMAVMAGWKPPEPSSSSVGRPRAGRMYSALANALKEAHGSQLHLPQDRIPLTVF